MLRSMGIYFSFIMIGYKSLSETRSSFFWTTISKSIQFLASFIMIWIMINKFGKIGEWLPYEVLLLASLSLFSYSIAGTFFMRPCSKLSERIQSGEFDEVLIKPLNPFFYYLSREASFGYAANFLTTLFVMIFSFYKLNVTFNLIKIFFLLIVVLSGALLNAAFFILGSLPAFWFVKSERLFKLIVWDIRHYTRYPISIYQRSIQVLLTFIFPFAFINFYPLQYFLGKNEFLMFHPVFQFLAPVFGISFFALAYLLWNIGINHYKSTGT